MELIAITPHKKRYKTSSLSEFGFTKTNKAATAHPVRAETRVLKVHFCIVIPTKYTEAKIKPKNKAMK